MSNEKKESLSEAMRKAKDTVSGQPQENPTVLGEILSWGEVIVVALVLAWLITSFIIVNATVPTGSMENTIMPGNRLFGLPVYAQQIFSAAGVLLIIAATALLRPQKSG